MQRIKLRGQWELSPDVKSAVALERAVAGDAASTRENHALTLGSRPFGSVGDSRTSCLSLVSEFAVIRTPLTEIIDRG